MFLLRGYSHKALKWAYKKALESPWDLLLFQDEKGSDCVNTRPIFKYTKQSNNIMGILSNIGIYQPRTLW